MHMRQTLHLHLMAHILSPSFQPGGNFCFHACFPLAPQLCCQTRRFWRNLTTAIGIQLVEVHKLNSVKVSLPRVH